MRYEKRLDREQRRRKRWFRFFRSITLLTLLLMTLGAGFIGGLFASVARVLPSGEALSNIQPSAPTRILASDGTLLGKVYRENREIVPINRMSYMPSATLAIEDIRFYQHPGVDPRGIARAMVANLLAGNSKEGASTITQQLARTLFLSRDKKLTRKLQEVVLALQIERRYSKQEILETYLNEVFYGSNRFGRQSYGVQTAAQNYFGKDISKLSLAESAMLAGLPKNPRDYNPYKYPDAAKRRRNLVLRNMFSYNLINERQYQEAISTPIKLAPERKPDVIADSHAPYFVRHILSVELPKIFGQNRDDLVYRYGLDVYTSLDPIMQKKAEDVVVAQVRANRGRKIDDGALISIDPQTGLIKAMVGGTDFKKDEFNIATQGRRQPGSAFKPFDYTTALLHGYTPDTIVHDSAHSYSTGSGGKLWSPKNSDGRYRGAMPLERAVWYSRNAAAVSVASDVGIKRIIDVAYRMGIKHELEPYLTTALGASVVVPMEICSSYGTLANHGIHHPPVGILRVTTHTGEVLYEYAPAPTRAVPAETADTMKQIMRGVLEQPGGTAYRSLHDLPFTASGKTGTTNSFRDAWFIGYTDDLVTAVWVGNRHNQSMNRTFGATVPVPIWKEYMLVAQPIIAVEHQKIRGRLAEINNVPALVKIDTTPTDYIIKHGGGRRYRERDDEAALPKSTPAPPPPPISTARETTIVCTQTHLRATPWCPDTMTITLAPGASPPSRTCNVHTGPENLPVVAHRDAPRGRQRIASARTDGIVLSICTETGKIATSKCPYVARRSFQPDDAPLETCPLHQD